jgi:O-antigen ligase
MAALFALLAVVFIVRDQGGYFPTSWGWSALALLGVLATWLGAGGRTDAGRLDVVFMGVLSFLTGWVALSTLWTVDRPQTVSELERWTVLLAGCAALLALVQRTSVALVPPALLAAIAAICCYALATRLDPTRAGFHPRDPTTGYRLYQPLGYWNALGGFAALGTVLALGIASDPGARRAVRMFAAAVLVPLPLALFFTFSRGAWLALAGGLLVLVGVSPGRLRVVAQGVALAAAPAVAIVVAARSAALTDQDAVLAAARHEGHRLAWIVVALTLLAAALVVLLEAAERRFALARGQARAVEIVLALVCVALVAAAVLRSGGPVSLAQRGYDSFVAAKPPAEASDLNRRLVDLNGNGRAQLWHVAFDALHGGRWLTGTGAGGFQRTWEQSPKANAVVRDAHGLYVETLSELGVVGLAAIVVLLVLPLAAGLRRRAAPLVPALAGAYATFLLHNAVDWDWELAGVALTGLFLGCLLLVAERRSPARHIELRLRLSFGVAAAALAGLAFVAAIGNGALARARSANAEHRYAAAADAAATARSWMPWSPEPLKALGESELERGRTVAARTSFRRAISVDPKDWQSWLDLAASVDGRARRAAVARARELYPTSPEVAEFEDETGLRAGSS